MFFGSHWIQHPYKTKRKLTQVLLYPHPHWNEPWYGPIIAQETLHLNKTFVLDNSIIVFSISIEDLFYSTSEYLWLLLNRANDMQPPLVVGRNGYLPAHFINISKHIVTESIHVTFTSVYILKSVTFWWNYIIWTGFESNFVSFYRWCQLFISLNGLFLSSSFLESSVRSFSIFKLTLWASFRVHMSIEGSYLWFANRLVQYVNHIVCYVTYVPWLVDVVVHSHFIMWVFEVRWIL